VSAPVMAYPIHGKPYRIYSDACDYGVAAILQQVQPIKIADLKGTKLYDKLKRAYDAKEPVPNLVTPINSKVEDNMTGGVFRGNWAENFEETEVQIERVIAYWSRILKPAERNYSPTEREALALKEGLIKFQVYLEGEEFKAITDHAALTWSRTFQNVNRRLLSWGTVFAAYPGMKIIHRAGRVHSNIDSISRLRRRIPLQEGPVSDDTPHLVMTNEDSPIKSLYKEIGDRFEAKVLAVAAVHARKNLQLKGNIRRIILRTPRNTTVSPDEFEDNICVQSTLTISMDSKEFVKFSDAYKDDDHFRQVLEAIQETKDPMNPPYPQYQVGDNGLLYFQDSNGNQCLCVPKALQYEVTSEIHDSP